jgi:hypothetical protein
VDLPRTDIPFDPYTFSINIISISSGNKSVLVSRLQEDDNKKTMEAVSTHAQVRQASTVATPEPIVGIAPIPGIPETAQADRAPPAGFLSTTLPDLSQPLPEHPVQIVSF